ncbi:hypothetical protein SAMN05421538_108120 [Paracoccus isoporae]|uniref:SAF domain-containing protein n=1 Tax=Paracoccus isoporae TaxID=591205 RepID=A0A1G7E840_9RHOB|nr:UxaA family hydrolase [Paracoccus isoporae]SDE59878.1 hypothetical protein SAMN05421538_108120 [Paracoccus isoporae]
MAEDDLVAGSRLLRLDPADNVLVATGAVGPGPAGLHGGGTLRLLDAVTLGHKVAARDISAGEKILKYGVPIGSAVCNIAAGSHVHLHNMKSDYTPTHALAETAKGHPDA